jgi:predicted amidohydrolase YtcJ
VGPVNVAREVWDTLSIEDIDRFSPSNPLMVLTVGPGPGRGPAGASSIFYNSQIRHAVLQTFGYDARGLVGPDGNYHGRGNASPILSIIPDVIIQEPRKSLAHVYRKEMEAWASKGVTTWSSQLTGLVDLNVYAHLDRSGEMPMRLAYSHGMGDTSFPYATGFYGRLGDQAGHGTPHLWAIGVAPLGPLVDYSPVLAAHLKEPESRLSFTGPELRANLLAKVKAGLRITGKDIQGDAAADQFMDIIEEASAAAGMSPDDIRTKRHAMDHCSFHPDEAQVERARRLGIIFACRPAMLASDADRVEPSGYDHIHQLNAPIKRILDGGGRLALELDSSLTIGSREGNVFRELLVFVNRTDSQGRVWGADQAIDRRTVLLMAARWSAEYVLREDVLGSLEPGKWADLLILDRDYLTASEDEFANMQVLLTIVGGKIVYSEPALAAAKGLPDVGARGYGAQATAGD